MSQKVRSKHKTTFNKLRMRYCKEKLVKRTKVDLGNNLVEVAIAKPCDSVLLPIRQWGVEIHLVVNLKSGQSRLLVLTMFGAEDGEEIACLRTPSGRVQRTQSAL